MRNFDKRFWPYKPKYSILLTGILFLAFISILKFFYDWPGQSSESVFVIVVLIISCLPVILALVDLVLERGGALEIKGIKIDLSKVDRFSATSFAMPANIAVPGEPISDSSTSQILHELNEATANDVVTIDLLDGEGWWETRLLVMLAGATRLGKPRVIVFVATEAEKPQQFEGWGYSDSLLRCLIKSDRLYQACLWVSRAAANQWALVEPAYPALGGQQPPNPLPYDWMQGHVSTSHPWMAFQPDGLPNELLAEQILANELGRLIEVNQGGKRTISVQRLQHLFKPALYTNFIDLSWKADLQKEAFFADNTSFVALANGGKFAGIASRATIFNTLLEKMFAGNEK